MIFVEYSNANRELQIETLNEEIESVVLEKHEFQNRDEISILKTFLVFRFQCSKSIYCF